MNEADGFAVAMIAMLTLSLGVVLGILFTMVRNGSKRDPEVDRLIEELEREEKKPPAPKAAPAEGLAREAWEKEADWWKKDG